MRTAPPPHGGSRKDWLGLSVSSSNGIVLRDLQLAKYWLVQYAILWRILKFHELHAYLSLKKDPYRWPVLDARFMWHDREVPLKASRLAGALLHLADPSSILAQAGSLCS